MLRQCNFFLALCGATILSAAPLYSQSSSLIAAGKKEGKTVVYGSLESDTADAAFVPFKKKTGIDVEYWRASATKVMDRALSEYRAGKPLFDIILTNDNPMQIMFKEGLFAKYDSPAAKGFHARSRSIRISVRAIATSSSAWSTTKTSSNPPMRPSLSRTSSNRNTAASSSCPTPPSTRRPHNGSPVLDKLMGKEKSEKFIRDLAAQKPILVESLLPAAERVATGETPIAITYVKYVYMFGQRGAPLDYVRLGKFMGDGHYLGLNSKAPHANAGKAFIDYFLGAENMATIAKLGEFVNRKGIYPPLPDADKIQFVEMYDLDSKKFAEKKKEYQQIFLH